MNNNQKSAIGFIFISAVLAFKSDNIGAYICLGAGIALFGFHSWLERNKKDEFQQVKEEIQRLKDKIQSIQLGKMTGR